MPDTTKHRQGGISQQRESEPSRMPEPVALVKSWTNGWTAMKLSSARPSVSCAVLSTNAARWLQALPMSLIVLLDAGPLGKVSNSIYVLVVLA
jgi:hypothetical protein